MRYLHTMLRVRDLEAALDFFVTKLGLRELRRQQNEAGRVTLVFLGTGAPDDGAQVELTHNWDQAEPYPTGRFFGHLAYEVDDIYATCAGLQLGTMPAPKSQWQSARVNGSQAPSTAREVRPHVIGAADGPDANRG